MRSVVDHFVSYWCWSGNLMDERRGKVVCHLRIGGDLKKEMKLEYWVGLYTWKIADGRELSFRGHHRGKYVRRRNHYCIRQENSERKDRIWTSLVQCHECQTKRIDERVRYCGQWYQRRPIDRDTILTYLFIYYMVSTLISSHWPKDETLFIDLLI